MIPVDNAKPSNIDTADYSYQVSLLQLNLHLAEAEQAPAPQRRAHTEAVAQLRTLADRR